MDLNLAWNTTLLSLRDSALAESWQSIIQNCFRDSIVKISLCYIMDCHELRCNSCNDAVESVGYAALWIASAMPRNDT